MKRNLILLLTAMMMTACNGVLTSQQGASGEWSLKGTFGDKFLVGTAVNSQQFTGQDTLGVDIIKRHFNAVVAENCMKCEVIHPEKDKYDFVPGDSLVDFAEANDITVTGHCLIWHSQCAPWFFVDEDGKQVDADELKRRMEDHITTIVTHYKGRVKGWDVVNEAFMDDGTYRKSKFYEILGEEFIPLAFEYAHNADPEVELYYNDYGMNLKERRDAVVKLVKSLKERNLRIDAVGMQAHMGMDYPDIHDFEESIEAFADAGVNVMITEWDMSVLPTLTQSANVGEMIDFEKVKHLFNPYPNGLPDSLSRAWNERMMSFFHLFLKHSDVITRVTTWGVSDGDSWRNYHPRPGRVDYPLLFDRRHEPKPFVRELCNPKKASFSDFTYASLEEAVEDDSTRVNPILPGCYPDPSICRVGEDYYLVNSSFVFYPGIPIWHSSDLKNWEQLGYVLNRPELDPLPDSLRISGGIYAPDIKFNPVDSLFYLIVADVDGEGTFYVTTSDPYQCDWSERHYLPEVGGIDPSFLFDSDGHAYIVNCDIPIGGRLYPGHCAIYVREFDYSKGTVAPQHLIINAGVDPSAQPVWIEGPHLYHIGDTYYLMAAEGGTGPDHSEVIFRADSPLGPFVPCDINPILTQRDLPADRPNPVTCTGHADLVETADGDWYAVFLGVRPYRDYFDVMGRETFLLPVSWEDNQPVILPDGEVIHYTAHPLAPTPLWTSEGLAKEAIFVRTPQETFYDVDNRGNLRLKARSVRINEMRQPTVIGRWVTSTKMQAETIVDYAARTENDFAGLTLFYDDHHYVIFGKTSDATGQPRVALLTNNSGEQLLGSELLEDAGEAYDGPLWLKVESDGEVNYTFSYKTQKNAEWTPLGEPISADMLSTAVGGGFTGTLVGIYATGDYEY